VADPIRREYLKRGPAPKVGLLGQPGVTEAIKKYFSPKEILKRGFYPVGSKQPKGVIDQPTVSMSPWRFRGQLNKYMRQRYLQRLNTLKKMKKEGHVFAETGLKSLPKQTAAEKTGMKAITQATPRKLVKELGGIVPADLGFDTSGMYNPKSREIWLARSMLGQPVGVMSHELAGHHGVEVLARPGLIKGSRKAITVMDRLKQELKTVGAHGHWAKKRLFEHGLGRMDEPYRTVSKILEDLYYAIPEEQLAFKVGETFPGKSFSSSFAKGLHKAGQALPKAPKVRDESIRKLIEIIDKYKLHEAPNPAVVRARRLSMTGR
jgi:hypothetical protein